MPGMVRRDPSRAAAGERRTGDDVEVVPEDLARWAVGPGRDVVDRTTNALLGGEDELAIGTRLRDAADPRRAAFAMGLATTRVRALAQGLPHAGDLLLTREALEQASHPAAAAWRAERAASAVTTDPVLQDRCAGTGGDAVALAVHRPVLAVERDPGRAVLAMDRAAVLGADVEVRIGDALDPGLPSRDAVVHADPDRRDASGRRARRLDQHQPGVAALLAATTDAAGRLLTVAPGVAWDDPALPSEAEVVFLQHGPDLLEAVLCTGSARQPGARASAVLLDRGLVRTRTEPVVPLPVADVGSWLLTPAPALVRARLHDQLGADLDARRIARRSALLTTTDDPGPTPWARAERVEAVLPARPRVVRRHLRDHPDRRVELVLHGVQLSVPDWLRAAGDPATGPDDLRIHLVRRDQDAVAVLSSIV